MLKSNIHRDGQVMRGFTLIELLVVISIISLLIAILLPALGAARDAAKTMLCLNNQRTIGLSMFNYANDNKDLFVPAKISPLYNTRLVGVDYEAAGTKYSWPALIKQLGYLPSGSDHTAENWTVFACEASPNQFGNGTYDNAGWFTYFISYGYNWN